MSGSPLSLPVSISTTARGAETFRLAASTWDGAAAGVCRNAVTRRAMSMNTSLETPAGRLRPAPTSGLAGRLKPAPTYEATYEEPRIWSTLMS